MESRVQAVTGKSRLEAADDVRKRLFVIVVAAVIAPVNIAFMVGDILAADAAEIIVDVILAASLTALVVSLARLRNPQPVYRVVLAVIGLLILWWAADPGPDNQKLYWIFIFEPAAMFVLGKAEGMVWTLGLLVCSGLVAAGIVPGSARLPFGVIARYLSSYGIIVGLSYVFESSRERTYAHLLNEHEELQEANTRIRKMSITDSLTGTYNRQFLADRFPAEVERSRRYGHPLAVILCDVDRFKLVNDTYGHQVGDRVLQSIATSLQSSIRQEVDWIVRYGGEEFLIVLPETPVSGALGVAERLRVAVESTVLETGDGAITATASFGVSGTGVESVPGAASTAGATPLSVDDLVRAADLCLYEAKQKGRNRVVASHRKAGAPGRRREIR